MFGLGKKNKDEYVEKVHNSEETDEEVETYSYTVTCDNCEEEVELEIAKGTRVKDYLKNNEEICESCGCRLGE